MSLLENLPREDDLLLMEPEELAGYLLRLFDGPRGMELHRHNFFVNPDVKQRFSEEGRKALMEAWIWLEHEGMIAPRVDLISGEGMFITRRGRKLLQEDPAQYKASSSTLPRPFLHPRIEKEVWPDYVRGRYDTAVFTAFREIEEEVRELGKFDAELVGTRLMRKAFTPEEGPLAPKHLPTAEQQAISDLFAGAIGYYKNPSSHRKVLHVPQQAAAILIFASHLMFMLESGDLARILRGEK